MSGTLPLFSDLGAGTPESGVPEAPETATADAGQRHLWAAWRLSRSMRRYRAGSAEETRAGRAICRHLQALLQQGEPGAAPPARK